MEGDENWMGNNISVCAFQMGKAISIFSNDTGGYDLIGFQEASNIGLLSLSLPGMKVATYGIETPFDHPRLQGTKKKIWLATAYNATKLGQPTVSSGGLISACKDLRPYQYLIFDAAKLIFIPP